MKQEIQKNEKEIQELKKQLHSETQKDFNKALKKAQAEIGQLKTDIAILQNQMMIAKKSSFEDLFSRALSFYQKQTEEINSLLTEPPYESQISKLQRETESLLRELFSTKNFDTLLKIEEEIKEKKKWLLYYLIAEDLTAQQNLKRSKKNS